jgi:hypothetical protein
MCSPQHASLFTLVMKFHDRQSSERCIRKLISRHCLEKTRTKWNDYLFLITDDRDFRPQTCTNGLVFRECKHIKNIFEDVYFTKNSFHITLNGPSLTWRSEHTSIEWRLAERQLQVKSYDSNSWFMDIRKVCIKYDITDPYTYLENPLPKLQWKSLITKHVHQYWKNAIEENMLLYTSLKYLDSI